MLLANNSEREKQEEEEVSISLLSSTNNSIDQTFKDLLAHLVYHC